MMHSCVMLHASLLGVCIYYIIAILPIIYILSLAKEMDNGHKKCKKPI